MATMSASQARTSLPEILDRVLAGEEVTITRHGVAVAVVIRPDMVQVRRVDHAPTEAARLRVLFDRCAQMRTHRSANRSKNVHAVLVAA